jgi:two-component system, NarL family, sensor kinase
MQSMNKVNSSSLDNILDEFSLSYHIENIPLGVIAVNKKWEIIFWSKRASEIFEWEATEMLDRPLSELRFIYEEDLEMVSKNMDEILCGNKDANLCVNRNYTKSGRVVYCEWYNSSFRDAGGNIVSILCFVHDITASKEAIRKLEHSQRQLSLIYNSAIDPMWLINVEGPNQFRFENINKSFTAVTGLQKEQVLGLLIEEVLPPSSHQLVKAKYTEAIRTGKVIDYEEIAMHPAGERVGEIRVIPVKNEDGKVTKIVGIANDITEKVHLQKKLDKERDLLSKKITAAAIQSQESERNNISQELHDNVNQVLTTVKLYTELCAAGSVDLNVFLPKCTMLLNETINEIRRLSKQLAAPSITTVGITEALRDLVESVQQTGELVVNLDTTSFTCTSIDEELQVAIYRIVQEQLTNILKHAKASQVVIRLACTKISLTLFIADNGVGFSTKKKSKGIGITNMTSRASLLNGELKIKSAKGKGSVLSVSFPVINIDGKCRPASMK